MDDGQRPITKAHLVTMTGELKMNVCLPFLKFSDPLPETHLFLYLVMHYDHILKKLIFGLCLDLISIAAGDLIQTFKLKGHLICFTLFFLCLHTN